MGNTGTTPDVVRVIYGGVMHMPGPVRFGATEMSGPKDDVYLKYRYGIQAADVVVVGQGVVGEPDQADCTMMEVTDQFVDGTTSLKHDAGSYTYTRGTEVLTKVARFNDPNGLHPPVQDDPNRQLYSGSEKAKVLNLGPFPAYIEMTVCNDDESGAECPASLKRNQFVTQNLWGQMPQQQPVAEQIIHLKAEYGMDDNKDCNKTVVRDNCKENDDRVDRFFHPDPDFVPPAGFWKQVRSVRLAIVSRSLTPDRAPCSATPDFDSDAYPVRWARGPNAPQGERIDVRTRADWQCFRYHVYETTVPVRNMLWRPE